MLVTIIIPVFNTSGRLETCLRSIASQTFRDWECILVDDGSTDGSGGICDSFAGADRRFRTIHQENGGVSAARNRGLDKAEGDYVMFVDSDDFVTPDCIDVLFRAAVASGADLTVAGVKVMAVDGTESSCIPSEARTFPLDREHSDCFVSLEHLNLVFAPFAKLYRKAPIDEGRIRFPEGMDYGEDLCFNLSFLERVSEIATVPDTVYCYVRNSDGLSLQKRDDRFALEYACLGMLKDFHVRKGLMTVDARRFLCVRFWGLVYDGLFTPSGPKGISLSSIRKVLSIPEIGSLKEFQDDFPCSGWIKRWILARRARLFHLYFRCSGRG